jgi:hypothetical protein
MTKLDDIAGNAETGDKHPTAVVNDGLNLSGHITWCGGQEIDTEWFGCCRSNTLHLVDHAIETHCRRTHATETTCLTHGGDEFGVAHASHAGEHHRMFDFEKVSQSSAHGCHGTPLGP